MAAAGHLWQDPGDTVVIQIAPDAAARLGAAVQQGLGSGPRGAEIGGILLGRMLPGGSPALRIEDFELVPSRHLRGASYTLSTAEQHLLGMRLKRSRRGHVAGFFRAHTRPGLYLDQDDFAVFSRFFADPSQVFLLVKSTGDGAAVGGFFFWEEGGIDRRAPYRRFPIEWQAPAAGPGSPRAPRRTPPVSMVVVPALAALFLIAALFVSPRDTPPRTAAVPRSAPVEALLPEPAPRVETAAPQPAALPAPEPPPQPRPAAVKPILKRVLRVPPRRQRPSPLDAPPPLAAAIVSSQPPLPPAALGALAPPAAEVTWQPARNGVFRRALRKIAAEAYTPAIPVRKVAPPAAPDGGEVDVKVFIDASGNVSRAQVLTKTSPLAAAALEAARQWRFDPARRRDQPAASEMLLHFHF